MSPGRSSATPTTDRDRERLALERARGRGDRRADPLGGRLGVLQAGPRKDEGELLAAVAGHEIHVADVRRQHAPDPAQDLVARLMTVRVVEPLEAVDVDNQQRERRPLTLPGGVAAGQLFVERPAVAHAGQRVGAGLGHVDFDPLGVVVELGLGLGQLRLQLLVGVEHLRGRGQERGPQGILRTPTRTPQAGG